ncbi:hypothetical protein [Kineobactrum salinum]|uniref:Uncharacterized protein n=1 Tax=Kineobactrum salinum TaxID=2708301 RepID=A0A6C0U5C8_9GAMM|nr:hypothetical protein [Kineobactrum salinum]QIB67372.1 hypothetical protein G3T16_20225 [Kineobactrum salinum]
MYRSFCDHYKSLYSKSRLFSGGITKPSGTDSLFFTWKNTDKDKMVLEMRADLLEEYIAYCVKEINTLLSAAKANMPPDLWTVDKSVPGRMLTTTNINALLICLRLIIERGTISSFDTYRKKFSGLKSFSFKSYHSSQYNRMAEALYKKHFG